MKYELKTQDYTLQFNENKVLQKFLSDNRIITIEISESLVNSELMKQLGYVFVCYKKDNKKFEVKRKESKQVHYSFDKLPFLQLKEEVKETQEIEIEPETQVKTTKKTRRKKTTKK